MFGILDRILKGHVKRSLPMSLTSKLPEVWIYLQACLSHCSTVMERRHDQGNSSKRKHLIGGLLTVLKGWFLIITMGSRQARPWAGAESFTSSFTGSRQRDTGPSVRFSNLKAHLQWHISSSKALPPNPFQTVLLTGDQV